MEGMIIPVPSTEPLTSRSAQTVWIWDTDASYIPVERYGTTNECWSFSKRKAQGGVLKHDPCVCVLSQVIPFRDVRQKPAFSMHDKRSSLAASRYMKNMLARVAGLIV